MQHLVQHFGQWLRKEWLFGVIFGVSGWTASRATRAGRVSLRERAAVNWPAIEGTARCRTVLPSPGASAMHMRVVPENGSELVFWSHLFSTREEGSHYAAALDGKAVPIHVNPEKPEERIVCWEELRRMTPAFAWPDGGRMSGGAFRWVRMFQAAVVATIVLFVIDLSLFATPWGRNFDWHGLCLCELSLGLLLTSGLLQMPAAVLRRRIQLVDSEEPLEILPAVTRWVLVLSIGGWVGLALFAAAHHGENTDAVFFGLITIPVVPLLWWEWRVAARAQRRLRPSEVHATHQAGTHNESRIQDPTEVLEVGAAR